MRRVSALACVAVAAALGLAACGGGGGDNSDTTAAATPPATTSGGGGGGGGGATIDFSTPSGSELAYNQKSASTKAGTDTISFDNVQAQEHDVRIEDSSGADVGGTDLVASGTATGTVDLQPGSYTFFCSVPGHREAGMEGTLTVK
jgi:plastocyanin